MRDGSRLGVLVRADEKPKVVSPEAIAPKEVPGVPAIPATPRVPRPMMLTGVTYKADSPIGKMYITINQDEKLDPFEVFINHGKSGSDLMAMADALGRMISFVLRIHSPVPARERMREIVSELSGIGGSRSIGFGENRVRSLPDAVAKVLSKHFNFRVNGKVEDKVVITAKEQNGEKAKESLNGSVSNGLTNGHANGMSNGLAATLKVEEMTEQIKLTQLSIPDTSASLNSSTTGLFDICPECGSGTLAYEEGCKKCYACGYSEC